MLRLIGWLGLWLCWAGASWGQPVPAAEAKEGFVSLFNGKDFSGWRFGEGSALGEKMPANWKVAEGVIQLSGGGSPHVASQWDYEDFDCRLEWRGLRERYNSGFFIRSGRKVGANQINLAKGGEGAFLGGKIQGAKAVPKLQKPPMEWNEWRVLAVGDKVTFWCNGQLAWEGSGWKTPRGYLGLQAEGAPMEFRNVRIKEIGFDNLNTLAQWKQNGAGWKQEADRLVGKGKGATLATLRQDYHDYILRLEWQGAGGVLLRGPKAAKSLVQLGGQTGSLPALGVTTAKTLDNPAGQWNYLELRVQGEAITVWLNGTVVVAKAALGDLPKAGSIGLQSQGERLQVRNVRIRVRP